MHNITIPTTAGQVFLDELPTSVTRKGRSGAPAKYEALYITMANNPSKWTAIKSYPRAERTKAYAFVNSAKAGKVRFLSPAVGVEVAWRSVNNEYVVYARYVGADAPELNN